MRRYVKNRKMRGGLLRIQGRKRRSRCLTNALTPLLVRIGLSRIPRRVWIYKVKPHIQWTLTLAHRTDWAAAAPFIRRRRTGKMDTKMEPIPCHVIKRTDFKTLPIVASTAAKQPVVQQASQCSIGNISSNKATRWDLALWPQVQSTLLLARNPFINGDLGDQAGATCP